MFAQPSDQEHATRDWATFRRELHARPELSEQESGTAQAISGRLESMDPTRVLTGLGHMQTGVCAEFDSGKPGPTVLLRCELDALPILETNDFAHRSTRNGVSHKCGHDGHMAILVAVADGLRSHPIESGRVLLLFQPAEETGTGASAVIDDDRFRALGAPDFAYALHNVPRYPLGQVLVRRGLFCQGSAGFMVRFTGVTSHASYPEHGINPSRAVTELVSQVNCFHDAFRGRATAPVLGTVTFAQLGSFEHGPNFGTAPGQGMVTGVVRAQNDGDLDLLRKEIARLAMNLAAGSGLKYELGWHDVFAPTVSDDQCTQVIRQAAIEQGLDVKSLDEPFRWSEDFGYFSRAYTGAFFGLGSGLDQPQLHDSNYDFPDGLIPIGARLFRGIIDRHLSSGACSRNAG